MRRAAILASVVAVAFTYAGLAALSRPPAAAATAATGAAAAHPLVGSWLVDLDADDPANPPSLLVVHADGTCLTVDGGEVGVGAWAATGERTATLTIVVHEAGAAGAVGIGTIRAAVTVSGDGLGFTATYTREITGPDGSNTGEDGPVPATGTRIAAEPIGTPVGPPPAAPAGTIGPVGEIFGGAPYSVSQDFGPTSFSPGPGAYDYSAAYGLQAGDHAGVDLAVPYGTPLYAPVAGEVIFAGPSPFFAPQHVQLQLADGTIVIFGNMSEVAVAAGERVEPGRLLGASGTSGVGPHLHLEVRVPDPATSSGMRVVDPLLFFAGGPDGPAASPAAAIDAALAAAIDARIALSNDANGQTSPLTGMGATFVELGWAYGINPAVVTAILQLESQLGADGSILPTLAYNFGGLTGSGNCGSVWIEAASQWFAKFCTVEDGLAANFAIFNLPIYRETDGTLEAVMELYAPPEKYDRTAMWATFAAIGEQLGVPLDPDTQVFVTA
jgi:murein DD-endopeptidase MepM/ murein hydrolase activator NlpD